MKKTLLVMAMVMTMMMATTATALADRFDPDDALDTDEITVDVACDTSNVDGVDGPFTTPGGDSVFRIAWEFGDLAGEPFTYVWETQDFNETAWDEYDTGNVGSPGADGHWYPPHPSEHQGHRITYTFPAGEEITATATFAESGCITDVEWTDEPLAIDVQFSDSDGNALSDLEVEPGDEVDVFVSTTNNGDATLNAGWKLGVEVEDFDSDNPDVTIEYCTGSGCVPLTPDMIEDNGTWVIQIEGDEEADDLGPGDNDLQHFRVIFGEVGSFTGTVFVFGASA